MTLRDGPSSFDKFRTSAPPQDERSFANPARGEAFVEVDGQRLVLRPSFSALVAAESEIGPLFALVERAAEGRLGLGELAALFWHCLADPSTGVGPEGLTRDGFGEGLAAGGLARATPALKVLLGQILLGK